MDDKKICSKCKNYKSLNEYHKAKKRPMGVRCACKECEIPEKRRHYQNNKDKYKQAYQNFMKRNPNYHSIKILPLKNEDPKIQSI